VPPLLSNPAMKRFQSDWKLSAHDISVKVSEEKITFNFLQEREFANKLCLICLGSEASEVKINLLELKRLILYLCC